MNITLKQLQNEVSEWSQRNFPNNKPHHPLLGIVEEYGELDDSNSLAEVKDAIADAVIYLADYCARNGLKLRHIGKEPNYGARWLCHYHLKGEQGIRYLPEMIINLKQGAVDSMVSDLKGRAEVDHVDFYETITETWNAVKLRDWQKNPLNAASV